MERTASDWRTANPRGALVPRGLDPIPANDITEFPDERVAKSAGTVTRAASTA